MNCPCGNLQQFQTDRINPLFSEISGQYNPAEPIEQVICQRVDLQSVGIYKLLMTADGAEIKAAFGFLDEVLHFPRPQ